ncbi:TAXI family TRAP transporter solute-binding subunit [Paracoccus sediminicola]|uniref:TAXI family TRAP transporter solute-binding subunit n=1 Tax=Paracoccus sediminicola TaxID=3017783 RepID=UPI0022F0308E|nr:TAXI family TRAP transporter solute-binding subunit [Paracoccus sediminicola]WBU56231.1 TAXI family TRAP transporter solute-binding subunit [Paracoccus sediminicola]
MYRITGFFAAFLIVGSAASYAQDTIELPDVVTWSAYGTGSTGNAQAVAIGSALQNELDKTLRILPGKNDVSRMVPLRDGRVMFSAAGIATFYAQEGIEEFNDPEWGPQRVRVLLTSNPAHNQGVAATAESGIETVADLEGRRVAAVVGSPAINNGIEAVLAFAGLSWDDVERVDFPGYSASWEGMLNGQVDAAWGATTISSAFQLESSPRGIRWLTLPPDDTEGWKRLQSVAPHIVPHQATIGAGISEDNPQQGTNYPYPILIAYAQQDPALVEAMTRAMVDLYPTYSDASPGADGWALENQILDWIVPFHEGAIPVLEAQGVWSPEAQAHNDALVERQDRLAEAWEGLMAQDLSGGALVEAWATARADIPMPGSE